MNPLKSQIKITVVNDIGTKLDDMREAAQVDIYRKEGAHGTINDLQNSTLKSIMAAVDTDRDDGHISLPDATLVKQYLMKVHHALDNLRIMVEKHRLVDEGRVAGLQAAIKYAQKTVDAERKQLTALSEGLEDGSIRMDSDGAPVFEGPLEQRPSGVRPAMDGRSSGPLADLEARRAEARALKEAKAVEVPKAEVPKAEVPKVEAPKVEAPTPIGSIAKEAKAYVSKSSAKSTSKISKKKARKTVRKRE
jgi:hypothetical protein